MVEVKAQCRESERRIVRSATGRTKKSGRISVPGDWIGEEVLVLRIGNPPHVIVDGKTAIEDTLEADGHTVIVLNADSLNPTRLAIPDNTLDALINDVARRRRSRST